MSIKLEYTIPDGAGPVAAHMAAHFAFERLAHELDCVVSSVKYERYEEGATVYSLKAEEIPATKGE